MVFVTRTAVGVTFHKGLTLDIFHTNAVEHHMDMDVAAFVVAFIMCTDEDLMPGKISGSKFHTEFLCPFHGQSAFWSVARIEAQDVMV